MELNQTKIHVVVEHSDSEDEMFIGTIDTDAKEKVKEWKVDLKINSRKATFKIDMGAQCNVMLLSLYKQVTKEKVQRSTTKPTLGIKCKPSAKTPSSSNTKTSSTLPNSKLQLKKK